MCVNFSGEVDVSARVKTGGSEATHTHRESACKRRAVPDDGGALGEVRAGVSRGIRF